MKAFTILLMFYASICFSQEREIVRILNNELKKELKSQFRHPSFDGDTITLVKEFSINNKILSFEIKRSSDRGYFFEKQEVPLSKIRVIGKDINIILESDDKAVKTTTRRFYKDQEKEEFVSDSDLFFVYINFPNNEDVGNDLIKAFAKAGYHIKKNYWYD
jgi:hypothetical protein